MTIILDSTPLRHKEEDPLPPMFFDCMSKNPTSNSKHASTGKISAGEIHVKKISEHMKQAAKLKFM